MTRVNSKYTFELFDSKGKEVSSSQLYKAVGFTLFHGGDLLAYYDFPKRIGSFDKKQFIEKIKKQYRNKFTEEKREKLKRGLKRDFKKLEKIIEEEEKLLKNELIYTRTDSFIQTSFMSKRSNKRLSSFAMRSFFTPTLDLRLNLELIKKELLDSFTKFSKQYSNRYADPVLSNEIYVRMVVPPMASGSDFDSVIAVRAQKYKTKIQLIDEIMKALKSLLSKKDKKENYKNIYQDQRIGFLGFSMEALWPVTNEIIRKNS